MTGQEVQQIIDSLCVPHSTESISLVETHISWVLLSDNYAYKIKKPLSLGFLDFSTLELRKEYCEKEVDLNRRMAPSMYLGVLPIGINNGSCCITEHTEKPVDYCVWMLRMDEGRQLDLLLAEGGISVTEIEKLAEIIAEFHQKAMVVAEGEDWEELYREFADVLRVKKDAELHFGEQACRLLEKQSKWALRFLDRIQLRIAERNEKGYVIDGHGDLHCRNIFLTDPPVIFDCIEFNDEFRKLDLLNEIAFLCMDLERLHYENLSDIFRDRYLQKIPCIENKTDGDLFHFYKLHRANVRLKIHLLNARKNEIPENIRHEELQLAEQYLKLSEAYYNSLEDKEIV